MKLRGQLARNLLMIFLIVVSPLSLVVSRTLATPIAFEFVYADNPGVGFNDPVFGQQARAALETAGGIWSVALAASYPAETITVASKFIPTSFSLGGFNPLLEFSPPDLFSEYSGQSLGRN